MAENQTAQQPVHHATEENALSHRIAQKADNMKHILLAAVVILAAAVAIFLYMGSSKAKRQAAAADKVFRSFVDLQGKTPAEVSTALAATAKEFAGQPAGIQAAVHAFGTSMDAKKYADAEKIGKDFIKNYPGSTLIPRFKVAVAQSLLQQGKTAEAIEALAAFAAVSGPETLPESKLALAQAREQFAEEAKANPEEYRRRLEAAQTEYNDITSRARLASPAQRGFWPQAVTLTADYALVQIKDRLAGHELGAPVGKAPEVDAAVTPAELETVQNLRPPSAGDDADDTGDQSGESEDAAVVPPLIGVGEPAAAPAAEEPAAVPEETAAPALEQDAEALEEAGETAETTAPEEAEETNTAVETAAETAEETKTFGPAARLRARAVGSAPAAPEEAEAAK